MCWMNLLWTTENTGKIDKSYVELIGMNRLQTALSEGTSKWIKSEIHLLISKPSK